MYVCLCVKTVSDMHFFYQKSLKATITAITTITATTRTTTAAATTTTKRNLLFLPTEGERRRRRGLSDLSMFYAP